MLIDNLQIVPTDGVTRVSADVDGYEVWFNVPGDFDPNRVGNAFLATVFFPAMAQGGELRFGDGFRLSRQLLNELPTLQKTFGAWSKNLQSFTVAPTPTTVVNASEQVGSLFSGSIDSICTLLQHSDEITDLVHIAGFEFAPAASGAPDPIDALRAMADKYKKPLRVLETNALKFAYEQKIARDLYHGSLMAAASHILGCKKTYFPSGADYATLLAWGSHPLTDPSWGSENVLFVHDGAEMRRIDKIDFLRDHEGVLENIVVCWERQDENCCRCNKCLRTMIAYELLGIPVAAFPERVTSKAIRNARFTGSVDHVMFNENLAVAREQGHHDLVRAMSWAHTRKVLPKALGGALRVLDEAVFAGAYNNCLSASKPLAGHANGTRSTSNRSNLITEQSVFHLSVHLDAARFTDTLTFER